MITDFHSHILPGIDDGSTDTAQSLEMLRMEAAQQIGRVVATPHFYPRYDDPKTFLARRAQALTQLSEAMAKQKELPRLEVGAEVHYYPGMSDSEALSELTIAGSRYILVEMPGSPWTATMFRELEDIYRKQGLTPVLAHIDRYITPFQNHGILGQLERLPVLIQANGSFFLKRGTAAFALRLLRQGRIHLLGSDCHDPLDRPPNLEPALRVIRRKLGQEALEHLEHCSQIIFSE